MTLSAELCGGKAKGGRQHGRDLVVSLQVKFKDPPSDNALDGISEKHIQSSYWNHGARFGVATFPASRVEYPANDWFARISPEIHSKVVSNDCKIVSAVGSRSHQ
jgi:hypothetical protein